MRRLGLLAALLAALACFGALQAWAALASSRGSDAPWVDAFGNVGLAAAVPTGYWVDVDEAGTTTSAALGGSGNLAATGTGNVNYGFAQECAATANGGPFSSGHYPPQTCAELGRPYSSSGPPGFWFTGNEHCVSAGRPFSGSVFIWHVQLPQSGPWHVEAHIPSWTMYGQGNHYIVSSDEGRSESVLSQEASHGQWVTLGGGTHNFTAGQDYTVELTQADTENGFCKYQMADQMKWVYDGATVVAPVNTSPPMISGKLSEGQVLTASSGSWTESPTYYSYQWEDCGSEGKDCQPISGATSASYTLLASDVGHKILVQVTAHNQAGAGDPALSGAIGPIFSSEQEEKEQGVASSEPPIDVSPPIITGSAVEGQTLTVLPGHWSGSPTTYTEQWETCTQSPESCAAVPGATSTTYRLSAADVEHTLRVRETASNVSGISAPVYSQESRLVGVPPPPALPTQEPCPTPSSQDASSSRARTANAHTATYDATTAAHHARRHSRQHSRVTLGAALRQTVKSSRHFTLTLQLTEGVRNFLGYHCPAPLTGAGIVNFKARAASWTITLPPSLGGAIRAVARRNTIYLSSSLLTPKGGWLALRTRSDYAAFERVPMLRDIVAMTDPLGSITLVASAPRGRPTARRATAEPQASLADTGPSVKQPCNNGAQVANSSGETSNQLTDTFSYGTTADADALKAWAKNHVSADAGQDGLCEISVSLENADNNGFDVTVEFANPVPPLHIPAAGLTDALTYTQTYHYREPCMAGTWEGTDAPQFSGAVESEGRAVSPSNGKGTVRLVMTTTSATLETTEKFEGGYTHPFPEFTLGLDDELLTVEGSITVPYNAIRTISVSGPIVLTGEDAIQLSLGGNIGVTVDAPPFTIDPAQGPGHLIITGTLMCPATLMLDDPSLGELTLSKTSSALAFPVLTSVEQSWQQQLQAIPSS